MTETIEDYKKFINRIVLLGDEEFSVPIRVEGVRYCYGRIDVMIRPLEIKSLPDWILDIFRKNKQKQKNYRWVSTDKIIWPKTT